MTKKHHDARWQRLRKQVRPRLESLLPAPCPRCGRPMVLGMKLDVGHITRHPGLTYDPSNTRLEHRRCNRQDGQRITSAMRRARGNRKAETAPRPKW